jgi:hypothetical protein
LAGCSSFAPIHNLDRFSDGSVIPSTQRNSNDDAENQAGSSANAPIVMSSGWKNMALLVNNDS